jgi:hypothetical protein
MYNTVIWVGVKPKFGDRILMGVAVDILRWIK